MSRRVPSSALRLGGALNPINLNGVVDNYKITNNTCPQARSVRKVDVCWKTLHNFRQIGGACGYFCAEPPPKAEVGVKAPGDVGCGSVRVVGCGEGLL